MGDQNICHNREILEIKIWLFGFSIVQNQIQWIGLVQNLIRLHTFYVKSTDRFGELPQFSLSYLSYNWGEKLTPPKSSHTVLEQIFPWKKVLHCFSVIWESAKFFFNHHKFLVFSS
jgi:hypothetical protein